MAESRRTPDDFAAEMAARKEVGLGNPTQDAAEGLDAAANGLDSPTQNDDEIVARGRTAAERLAGGQTWTDWVAVGRAFRVGRNFAMRIASTNQPKGKRYALAFGLWLKHKQLDQVADKGTRSNLLDLIDNLEAVEAWRAELPLERQLKLNHPRNTRDAWRRSRREEQIEGERRPSALTQLRESVEKLENENFRLRSGGHVINAQVRPPDVARILISLFSADALAEIRELLTQACNAMRMEEER
jgi:hypothetical protein